MSSENPNDNSVSVAPVSGVQPEPSPLTVASSKDTEAAETSAAVAKPSKKLLTAEEEAELVMAQMALKEAERADRLRKREAEAAAERAKQLQAVSVDSVGISDSLLLEAADEMWDIIPYTYSLL